jgi:hypothetical protein
LQDRIEDINKHCLDEFRTHWKCLENHNQQLWNCRSEERRLNKCVFTNLVREAFYLGLPPWLTSAEIGEDDTRHAQGRDPRPPADTPDLCETLELYITPLEQESRTLFSQTLSLMRRLE